MGHAPSRSQPPSLDDLQTALDVAGFVDPTGAADLANAGISTYRGDYTGAAISLAAIFGFDILKGLKRFRRGGANLAKGTAKQADEVAPLVKKADEAAAEVKAVDTLTSPSQGLPPLRQAYIQEVEALKDTAAQLSAAGKTPEEIARTLHQMRRDIGIKYKDLTPPDMLERIYQRNLEKYGDKLGPTIDYLRSQGKTWEEIIESASRTGGADLGLAKPK